METRFSGNLECTLVWNRGFQEAACSPANTLCAQYPASWWLVWRKNTKYVNYYSAYLSTSCLSYSLTKNTFKSWHHFTFLKYFLLYFKIWQVAHILFLSERFSREQCGTLLLTVLHEFCRIKALFWSYFAYFRISLCLSFLVFCLFFLIKNTYTKTLEMSMVTWACYLSRSGKRMRQEDFKFESSQDDQKMLSQKYKTDHHVGSSWWEFHGQFSP